jgi:hypothetical protein
MSGGVHCETCQLLAVLDQCQKNSPQYKMPSYELCPSAPSYGDQFFCFLDFINVIRNLLICSRIRNCIFMFQGLSATSMAWYYAAQIPRQLSLHLAKVLSGLQCLPEGLLDRGVSSMS